MAEKCTTIDQVTNRRETWRGSISYWSSISTIFYLETPSLNLNKSTTLLTINPPSISNYLPIFSSITLLSSLLFRDPFPSLNLNKSSSLLLLTLISLSPLCCSLSPHREPNTEISFHLKRCMILVPQIASSTLYIPTLTWPCEVVNCQTTSQTSLPFFFFSIFIPKISR